MRTFQAAFSLFLALHCGVHPVRQSRQSPQSERLVSAAPCCSVLSRLNWTSVVVCFKRFKNETKIEQLERGIRKIPKLSL